MHTPKIRNLNNLRKLLAKMGIEFKPARRTRISMTQEQYCGDPTEEIASYKSTHAPITPHSLHVGLEDFERDYHWFLA